jgi:hypothetical protein
VLNGAAVRIAIVGFDDGTETARRLDGRPVTRINADLTSSIDITGAARLPENARLAFMGDTKGGAFDVPGDLARRWLAMPLNPNARPNGEVVRPWASGLDITRRPRGMWIVDFGVDMPEHEAAFYEAPFVRPRARQAGTGEKQPGCVPGAMVAACGATLWVARFINGAGPLHRHPPRRQASPVRVPAGGSAARFASDRVRPRRRLLLRRPPHNMPIVARSQANVRVLPTRRCFSCGTGTAGTEPPQCPGRAVAADSPTDSRHVARSVRSPTRRCRHQSPAPR